VFPIYRGIKRTCPAQRSNEPTGPAQPERTKAPPLKSNSIHETPPSPSFVIFHCAPKWNDNANRTNTRSRRRRWSARINRAQLRLNLGLRLRLRLLHICHGVLAPALLQARAIRRLRADGCGRVHALGPRGLLHLHRLALPAGVQVDELGVELCEFGGPAGDGHDGGAGLQLLAGLGVLFCVLREVGEVGLEAAHVAAGSSLDDAD
jgi:hypothetical protein